MPDVYQGNELWDFSLVDPDNRRPVDYARRRALLERSRARRGRSGARCPRSCDELAANLADGQSEALLTWRGLRLRAERPELFERGGYVPLEVRGDRRGASSAHSRAATSRRRCRGRGRWFTLLPRAGAGPIASIGATPRSLCLPGAIATCSRNRSVRSRRVRGPASPSCSRGFRSRCSSASTPLSLAAKAEQTFLKQCVPRREITMRQTVPLLVERKLLTLG